MDHESLPSVLKPRKFGNTGLMVPPVAIGCAPLGNMIDTFQYAVSEVDAISTIHAALESPFDYIDTAAHYGDGESERRIGLALKQLGGLPKGAVLQTKAGRHVESNDYSGPMVKHRFERSLLLLGVERVDILYLHDAEHTTFEAAMAPGGPVEVLLDAKRQGLTSFIGVASGPNAVELQYIETGLFDAVITHNRYTLLNRSANDVIDAACQRGMAVLNAAPYGSGMLAKGTVAYPRYAYQPASEPMVVATRQYEEICGRYGVPLAAVALQFSTNDSRITSTIVGMSHPKRLQQTIDLMLTEIPAACLEEIEAVPIPEPEDPEKNRWNQAR
jgi:D-threo-aldose 1-dehydrogenase